MNYGSENFGQRTKAAEANPCQGREVIYNMERHQNYLQ